MGKPETGDSPKKILYHTGEFPEPGLSLAAQGLAGMTNCDTVCKGEEIFAIAGSPQCYVWVKARS